MDSRRYVLTIGVMLGCATLVVILLGRVPAPKSRAAGANSEQANAGPKPPPKPSPREFRELHAQDRLAGQLPNLGLPRHEPVYEPVIDVKPSHLAKGEILKVHRNIAKILNAAKLGPPPGRLAHFAWLGERPYRLLGWGGFIGEIESIPEGVAVTLVVTPSFQLDGGSATASDYYSEKYAVLNGQVHFLGGVDPPDAASGVALTD
jgi:hypothetical protein